MAEKKQLQVLKTAILLEKRGKAFYERVARESESPALADLFRLMAGEETKHIEYLSEQFASFSANGKFSDHDPRGESESAVGQILNTDIRNQISAAGFEAAAISAAIEMENRAVAVYSERAESSDEPNEKKLYAWLAQWEKGHLKFLAELNDELLEDVWYQSSFWPF